MKSVLSLLCLFLLPAIALPADEPIIVDHDCIDLTLIPEEWIDHTKSVLHIAYGHTSHGSQVTDGMTGLVSFTGGCGGPIYAWNNGGTGGALDLHDNAMGGDCGYYPDWVNNTRSYLDDPANADCNVIIWSWCGQHSDYSEQDMIDKYLAPMTQLEIDYPGVKFVYMTGHVEYTKKQNTDARNQQIRDYCIANNKILYDFAHIESYNPDKTFYEYVDDTCNYFDQQLVYQGNWAVEWQNAHVKDVEWYDCPCAHSEALNGNQKTYAAWWLWARLAGWPGAETLACDRTQMSANSGGTANFSLDAGVVYGNRLYMLCGTLSGTDPGTLLPGGLETIPINQDSFSNYIVNHMYLPNFSGFQGVLDGQGKASAVLSFFTPHPGLIGKTMHYAFCTRNPWDFASNATAIDLVQ